MNKNSLRFFAISIVFLCVAIVFYSQGGVSLANSFCFSHPARLSAPTWSRG